MVGKNISTGRLLGGKKLFSNMRYKDKIGWLWKGCYKNSDGQNRFDVTKIQGNKLDTLTKATMK